MWLAGRLANAVQTVSAMGIKTLQVTRFIVSQHAHYKFDYAGGGIQFPLRILLERQLRGNGSP
jgi:hypothetical protein